MEIRREMWMGAGALAFIGVVAWMIPPTTPLAPLANIGRLRASGVSGTASMAGAEAATPMAPSFPPGGSASDATPVADNAAPPMRLADAAPPQPRWHDRSSYDGDDQAEDQDQDQDAPPSPDQAFAMGYRWAQANGVDDRRACRRWHGPAEVGCLAFLHASDSGDDDTDVAQGPQ